MIDYYEIRRYFYDNVSPTFSRLMADIVKLRPYDIVAFSIKWFCDDYGTCNSNRDETNSEDIDSYLFAYRRRYRIANSTRKHRYGVSSAYTSSNQQQRKAIGLLRAPYKQVKSNVKILYYLSTSFLFQDFNYEYKQLIIERFLPKHTEADYVLIREGYVGDCMYFVYEGIFQCSKDYGGEYQIILKNYYPGDTFGELALLHNAARLATIVSLGAGMVYTLSRETYRHTRKLAVLKKRTLYMGILYKIDIFHNMYKEELEKMCDLLKETECYSGDSVIVEGDIGNKLYIVLSGILVGKQGHEQKIVQFFKEGDSFGYLGMLNNEPRKASIVAVTQATLMYLTRDMLFRVIDKDKLENGSVNKYARMKTITRNKRRYR